MKTTLLIAFFCLVISLEGFSQAISAQSGNWNDASTWVGASVPTNGSVIIQAGHTVIFNADFGNSNSVTITALTLSATANLRWPFSDDAAYNANFTLTCTGLITISASAAIDNVEGGAGIAGNATDRTHQFNIEGGINSLASGNFDMTGTTTARRINVDFNTSTQTVTGAGSYTFYNVDVDNGAAVTFSNATIDIDNVDMLGASSLTVDGGTINIGPTTTSAFEFRENNCSLILSSGTINIGSGVSTNVSTIFVNADNALLQIDGGFLNLGDNTTTGRGRLRVDNDAATNFNFDINGGTTTIASHIDFQSTTALMTLDISAGALLVGTGDLGNESTSEFLNGTVTVDGASAVLELGESCDFQIVPTIDNGATLSVGTNVSQTSDVDIIGAWVIDNGSTFNADAGMDLLSTGSLTIQGGSILNIVSDNTSTSSLEMEISGTLTVDNGTVNIAGGVVDAGAVTANLVNVTQTGVVNLMDGSISVLNNVGLTDRDVLGNTEAWDLNGAPNGTLNIGDGTGTAGSAVFNIATNLVSQSPPTEVDLFRIRADDGVTTVNSDGEMNIGGGNVGSILLDDDDGSNDVDFHLVVNGGTVNVAGTLDIDNGAGFQLNSGTVNVGLAESSGVNDIDFGSVTDPTSPTIIEITGGTMNVGDGAVSTVIGDSDVLPAHGDATAYVVLEVSGGTLNYNGRIRLRDPNNRFIVGGGATINFNPQKINNLGETLNILSIENGIIDIQGLVNINFLNPHAGSGSGEALQINGVGSGDDLLTSSYTAGVSTAVDFSNVTWGFGDGMETSTGGDGFDVNMTTGHTSYGSFVINNPSGTNREVFLTTSGIAYLTENVTITAGSFDIKDNTLDDDGGGATFLIDTNGTLALDTDFPGTSTPYTTYTINTGSTVDYDGTSAIANAQVPNGTAFSNLTVSGTNTKTFGGAATVNNTLTLSAGTLAASTNLTMAASSTISRSAGAMTGDIQGTADYSIEYTGLSKTIDDTTDPEWTGGGAFDLDVNLDANEVLTVSGSNLDLNDLTITSGSMTDASAFAHTIAGDMTINTAYTGLGTLNITGGTATHVLTSSGSATVSNLTMNDAAFDAVGDLDVDISGTLTLIAGDLNVTNGKLTINDGATLVGGSATSYIAFDGTSSAGGMKQTYNTATDSRIYPIGTSTEYTPGTVALTAASGVGALTIVPVASGTVFTLDENNALDLNYHWVLSTDGNFSGVTANHTFNYDDTDIRGVEGNYLAARYNVSSPSWDNSDDTADGTDGVNGATNTITLTGVDYIDGHITAGEVDEFSGVITTYYLRSDLSEPLDWNDGTHWTNTDGGTTPINKTPGANSPVVINRIVNVDADGQTAASITIAATGTLIIGENGALSPSSGHTFGTVIGTGELQLISDDAETPVFPDENGGNWVAFLGASGGTVTYGGDGSYSLPSSVSSYYNLTITSATSASVKSMADVDLTIYNDWLISASNNTTVIISDNTNGDITVGNDLSVIGIGSNNLQFQGTTARTISVANDVTVSATSTLDVVGTGTVAHTLSIGASLISNGTTDMNTGGSTVDVTFTGTTNETISDAGAGVVDFNRLIVNKGTSQSATLEATVNSLTITDIGDGGNPAIELKNGTFILSTGGTFTTRSVGDWIIPATAKLDMNSGSPTVQMTTSSAGNLMLSGSIQVTSGILNVGNQTDLVTDNSIRYEGVNAAIIVDGGIINIGGAIRPNLTDGSEALAFTLSSGIVSLARNTVTGNISSTNSDRRSNADFSLDNAACSFTMSGGVLEVIRAASSDGKAIQISSVVTNYMVTGGTTKIMVDAHDGFSTNNLVASRDTGISSNAPFWNLQIGDGDFPGDVGNANVSGVNALDLVILNDLTINLDNTLADEGNFDMFRVDRIPSNNEDGLDVYIGGNLTIIDGTFEVNDDGTGGSLIFNGSGLASQTNPQVITSNGETLGHIMVNNTSGSVDLADPLTISGNWTYTTGTFNQGGNTVILSTNVGVNATSINGNASFDDLTLSNTAGVSLSSGDLTINAGGVLTLSANVIFDIGDNGLTINETVAGGIIVAAASATNMIMVSGTTTAKGVTRAYPDATTSSFVFPVGTSTFYTPAQIDLTTAGGAGGMITVAPVASQHALTESSSTALDYYWQVTDNGGFNGSQRATHTYTYGTNSLVEGGDDTGFIGSYNIGSPTFNWETTNQNESVNVGSDFVTFTSPGASGDVISGDFTVGLLTAFPVVTVFYTIRDGDWNDIGAGTTPWTNDACGGAQTEVLAQPTASDPVVVCSGNTVTITTATGLGASAIVINGALTAQVADISTLGNIDGIGSLVFNHTTAITPVFGSLSSTFVGASGGSVEYAGTMAYTLPTQSSYNDLIISNTNAMTLPADITVNGDATFNGNAGTVTMGGFSLTDADNGGVFSLGANTTLIVDEVTNFPLNFGTYTLDVASTVDYSFDASTVQEVKGGITYGNLSITRVAGAAQKQLSGHIVIMGDLNINRRAELLSNIYNITIHGDWNIDARNNSDFDPGTGTVTFVSTAGNQIYDFQNGTNSESFYDLVINQSGIGTNVSFGGNVTNVIVQNSLIVSDETLASGTTPLAVNGDFTIGASGIFTSTLAQDIEGDFTNAGTFTVPNTVSLAGDFTNTGTYTAAGNTLIFDHSTLAQSVNGNATTFNNITVAKASGIDLTLNAATTINGTLALQNEGNIVLSSGDLTIAVGGSITGNAGGSAASDFSTNRMIKTDGSGGAPQVVKNANASTDWDFVFPIGVENSSSQYTPVVVDATNENITSGTLSVRSINGTGTTEVISGSATTLNRHFDFNLTGLTGVVIFDVLFGYEDADVLSGESTYVSAYSDGSGWTQAVAAQSNVNTVGNTFGASATLDGTISFGSDVNTEWIAGNNDLIYPHLYSYTTNCNPGPCDWNTAADWSLSSDGSTQDGQVPTADNAVTILASHNMVMSSNTNLAADIEVAGTLDIAATTGHTLGDVTGDGILQIGASGLDTYVNTGSGSTFFASGGGTVEYSGDAAYTLPATITTYQNLSINGTTQNTHDKTIGVNTTVLGDLTITNVDLENASHLDLELRGNFSALGGGTFQVANGNFIFANSATATLSSSIVFGASGGLILDNFGQKDLGAVFNANSITINSASGDFNANSNNINLSGDWNNKSSANKLTNPAVVTFNSGGAQQIDGDNTFSTTNLTTSGTAVTVNSGVQTFSGIVTLATGTTLDLGTNTMRISNTLDVDQGTFTASSGTLVYEGTSDPEVQVDPITVGTLEIDKGASTNTFDNDPTTVNFTNLTVTSGEYDGADMAIPGSLTLTAGSQVDLTGITSIDINGNLLNYSTIDLSSGSITHLYVFGDYTDNGNLTPPVNVVFDGTATQALNSNLSIDNFEKTGGGDLTLNADLTVNQTLTLTSGDIVPTTNNDLTLSSGANNPLGSTASMVQDRLFRVLATTAQTDLTFPLGDGTNYRPITLQLTQTAATSTSYLTRIRAGAATVRTPLGAISHVSGIRHYTVTPSNSILSGAPGANKITFQYGADDLVVDQNNLLVAKSDGSGNWLDLGGNILSGNATAGTIESTVDFSSFSDIVLASNTADASLPVELQSFEGEMSNGNVVLKWTTASELNNDYFTIERSTDGLTFDMLDQVDGFGTTNVRHSYSFRDRSPSFGISYYRLVQTDYDGTETVFDAIVINNENFMTGIVVMLYPNPSNTSNLSIKLYSGDENAPVYITVVDLMGQPIYHQILKGRIGESTVAVRLPPSIPMGIYHVLVQQGNNQKVVRLILN